MEQFTIYLKEPQKRQLLIELLMKMDFLEWEISISKNDIETANSKKEWTTLGSVNLKGKADNLNLRDLAYD
jgi:hypothetical protein